MPFANFGRNVAKLPLINPPWDWTGAELSYVNNSGLFENIRDMPVSLMKVFSGKK